MTAMRTTTLLIAGSLCAAAAATQPALQTLQLREQATAAGDWVTLAEIATVKPQAHAQAIGATRLTPAPPPGGSRNVSLGYIKMRLRRAGVDLREVQFTGATRVCVSRAPLESTPHHQAVTRPAAPTPGAGGTRPAPAGPPQEQIKVRRGTIVRLLVRRGALTIETTGELSRDCVVGALGKFRVHETRAYVVARLTDATTAEVIR